VRVSALSGASIQHCLLDGPAEIPDYRILACRQPLCRRTTVTMHDLSDEAERNQSQRIREREAGETAHATGCDPVVGVRRSTLRRSWRVEY